MLVSVNYFIRMGNMRVTLDRYSQPLGRSSAVWTGKQKHGDIELCVGMCNPRSVCRSLQIGRQCTGQDALGGESDPHHLV